MSTFTDWNGPQGGVKASDLVQLANAYTELVAKLNQHMADRTPNTSDVHGVKTYVESKIAEVQALIPSVSAFITESAADAKYALQSQIPSDVVHSADIANFVSNAALTSALSNYLRTNDLASQQVILDIQDDITAIETALAQTTFSKPILKATDYIEGLIHAVEQVKFTDKLVATHIGGSDANGKYWLIGMQTDDHQAGTAYIKYTNTKPFTAVVNFACSKVNGKYNGALSVVTDTVIDGLKFKLVYGTDHDNVEHVYLAVQAPEWLTLNQLEAYASGINFCPIGSEGCVIPNGDCHDIANCFANAGFSASKINVPIGHIGEVVGWHKFDANGVPIDYPDCFLPCDGSDVPDSYPELIAEGVTVTPVVDYCLIVAKTMDGYSNGEEPVEEDHSTILMPTENGTFTVDKQTAKAGETVTIIPAPDTGYQVAEITVIDDTETPVTVINNTFEMPDADVAIQVTFEIVDRNLTLVGCDFPVGGIVYVPSVSKAGDTITIRHVNAAGDTITFADNVYTITTQAAVNNLDVRNMTTHAAIVPVAGTDEWTFTMPDSDVLINIDFSG